MQYHDRVLLFTTTFQFLGVRKVVIRMKDFKKKYPETNIELVEGEKVYYIERDGKKYIPLEILGEMADFEYPGDNARQLFKRKVNYNILNEYSTQIKLILVENGIKKRRNIICLDIEGARLFMMLARTPESDLWKRRCKIT